MSHLIPLLLCCAPSPLPQGEVVVEAARPAPAGIEPELLDHEHLQQRLRELASRHPDFVTLLPIGFSREGRELDVVRLSSGEPPKARPAVLLVANLDGPQVFASAVALAHLEAIAADFTGASPSARVKDFFASTTLYVLPRANPDAAEARFQAPLAEVEAGGHGVDNDRDRRQGEDAPADVNGDGVVAWMRWEDPDGEWTEDPKDPRALIKADAGKGQRGHFKLAPEGRDLDHDEAVAEDPLRDTWLNQNFPHEWKEHGEHAGLFPLDEPEARALADFVLLRKDLALVVTYGTLDDLVEKPKSVASGAPPQKRIPQPGVIEPDAALLAELGKRYGELTSSKVKGRGTEAGSFQAWIYQHRGLFSLAVSLWDIPLEGTKQTDGKEAGAKDSDSKSEDKPAQTPPADAATQDKPAEKAEQEGAKDEKPAPGKGKSKEKKDDEPSDDAKRLQWIDGSAAESARFLPWTAFTHPELGAVEIGGFAPFARCEPPAADRRSIAERQLEFLLSLGAVLPRVAIEDAKAKDLGSGLLDVEAALTDSALLPLPSASGRRTDAVRPARIRLVLPQGAELLGGQSMQLVRELEGSGGRSKLRWLVRGARAEDLRIEVDTDNAGVASARVEVKR
jgi:zinc carboxypeptidase